MRKQTVPILIVAALALAQMAASAWAAPQAHSATKNTPSSPAHPAPPAKGSSASLLNPASLKLQAPAIFDARFTTTKGDFVVQVTRAWSPRGADRFYNLVKYHFFDGAAFFRVIQGFVVQFGISPRPDVSRAWENAEIADEPVTQSNTRGMLTFAKTNAPNTRTTQVFINLNDNSNPLDGMGFSPFGKVTSGMEVIDKLYGEYGDAPPDGPGPDQNRIQREGKAYLEKAFPLLDTIKTAVIVAPAPIVPSKPAVSAK
ncbi:MAG: peptidylprolyl isomerase [Terriglobia bacterium]|jgi:peptidyl-prolyl cis-trans isomerase A (cyclophilin A)